MEYSIDPRKYINVLLDHLMEKKNRRFNLENPLTILDKLAWLNIYDDNRLKTKCADKLLVREYCQEKLGKDICIPLIAHYDMARLIKWSELPEEYVIKCNHGSAMNIIVNKENPLDKARSIAKLNNWMQTDFAFKTGFEAHYHDIKRQILIEKYMRNAGSLSLFDYKFWCFNGVPKLYTINDGNGHGDIMYYTMDGHEYNLYNSPIHDNYKRPNNFEEMVKYAKILANPFKFVRVDFYEIEGTTYLGEMTFTPGACKFKYAKHEDEIKVGSMLDLNI